MLIYLDANIVQYCADFGDFVFGRAEECPTSDPKLEKELVALQRLVELERLGDDPWVFAAPRHLLAELYAGKPTAGQSEVYSLLREAWQDSGWTEGLPVSEDDIKRIYFSLIPLGLKNPQDRRHLAEAIAVNASFFLTNDKDIICKTRKKRERIGKIKDTWVGRPSECFERILNEASVGLFLK